MLAALVEGGDLSLTGSTDTDTPHTLLDNPRQRNAFTRESSSASRYDSIDSV